MLLNAFLVGGTICLIGQLIMNVFKFDTAHTMCILVTAGAVLSFFGIYQNLVEFAGAGATTPISSFGNVLLEGAREGMRENGFIGILTGLYQKVSAGIGAAVVFGFIAALLFKPKG